MISQFLLLVLPFELLLLASDGSAQTGALSKDPAILVKKYLSLDSKGARLDALSWEAQKPYIDWREEPLWGHVVVVSTYEVLEDIAQWDVKSSLDVVIPVEFKVLGSVYFEKATFMFEPKIERIGFRVKAVRGLWRIVEPIVPPHVGHKRMINFVRQAMIEETDSARLAALTALRDELRKAQYVQKDPG